MATLLPGFSNGSSKHAQTCFQDTHFFLILQIKAEKQRNKKTPQLAVQQRTRSHLAACCSFTCCTGFLFTSPKKKTKNPNSPSWL